MPLGVWEMIGEPQIRQSRFSFGQVFLTFANEILRALQSIRGVLFYLDK